jgi:hypothetical protein
MLADGTEDDEHDQDGGQRRERAWYLETPGQP